MKLLVATAFAAALGLAGSASAQPPEWPAHAVRLVLPVLAGSSADVVARALAQRLSAKWKQPVIVDNKPGGATIIAAESVAKSAPDGYTLGWLITAHAINATLQEKLPFDPVADFAGVTLLYQLKAVIVASSSVPANDIEGLLQWARKQGAPILYASSGLGTGPNLLGELFAQRYGLALQHVAYKGAPQAYPDVMSGRVPLIFDTLPSALPQAQAGKLKILAVVSNEPIPGHPELPILAGLLPREAMVGWNGIVVPANTPRAIVARLNADLVEAVHAPEIQALFAQLNVQTITTTPEGFDAFIRADIGRWAEVVNHAHLRAVAKR